MARYIYKAIGTDGHVMKGEMEAISSETVIRGLQDAGHLPIGAWEIQARVRWQYTLGAFLQKKKKAGTNDVVLLMTELSTLLEAGLPLDHALKMMEKLSSSPVMKEVINSVLQRIEAGGSLSESMMDQGGSFNRMQISMVRAGEASGELAKVIKGLSEYLERMSQLRSTVITALIYPGILLILAILSLLVLMAFVVPGFEPLFEDMGEALPLMTRITFGIAGVLQQIWWMIPCFILVIAWYTRRQLAKPQVRLHFDRWCLRVPFFGVLIRNTDMARLARTLGALIANGIPLLSAVNLVKEVVHNHCLSSELDSAAKSLEQGQGLSRPLRESQIFPALAIQLIEVGEGSGNLDTMLQKVADIYDQEVRTSLKRMLTLLEPVLILGLGGLIGTIIISILMAMLALNELVI